MVGVSMLRTAEEGKLRLPLLPAGSGKYKDNSGRLAHSELSYAIHVNHRSQRMIRPS